MPDLMMLRRLARSTARSVTRIAEKTGSLPSSRVSRESEAKSLTIQREPDGFYPLGSAPRAITSYSSSVRGVDSNVVMSPVMWVMRTFTEAVAVVQRRIGDDEHLWAHVVDHPVEELIEEPNEFYDGDALWKATVLSYQIDGNAYWLKIRNVYGSVIALWYIPHWLIRPNWAQTSAPFISHYDYTPGLATPIGGPVQIAVRDVVHFRFGLDPDNPRYGLSPLRAVMREVMTDDEAAVFSQTILANMGIPGLVISPKSDGFKPSEDQAKQLKEYFEGAFRGEYRGDALVMRFPTDISQFGFDANKVMLQGLRDLSEERVCAAIGIPSAVVGFGSGLQSTKVGATMRELRRLAWVQCLLPMQKSLAKQLNRQLLPDFVAQTRRFRMRFDDSDVSAFQEDDELFAKRITLLVGGGILRVDRAQQALGLEVDPTQRVYIRPSNATIVDEHGNAVTTAPADQAGADAADSAGASDGSAGTGEPGPTTITDTVDTPDEEGTVQKAQQTMYTAIAARLEAPFNAATWKPLQHTNGNGKRTGRHT